MKSLLVVAGFVSAFVLLGGRVASADLLNPSFELPANAPDSEVATLPDNWNRDNGSGGCYIENGAKVSQFFGAAAPNGTQVLDINFTGTPNELWQNTGIALQNGYTYTVAWMGAGDTVTATEYVRLWTADDANASTKGTSVFGSGSAAVATGAWVAQSVSATYTGGPGKYLTVGLDSSGYGGFDALTVSSTIPEPSTVVLVLTGMIGLLCYAWRKRK